MKRYSPILLLTLCIAIGSPPAAVRGELSSRQIPSSTLAPRSIDPRLIAQAESSDTPSEKPSETGKSSDKKSSQTKKSTGKTGSDKPSDIQWKKTLWWVGLGTTGVAAIAFLYFLFRLSRPQPAVQAIGPEFSPTLPEDEPELELDSSEIPVSQDIRSLSPASKDSSPKDSSPKDSSIKNAQNSPVSESPASQPSIPAAPPETPKEPQIDPSSVAQSTPPEQLQLERAQAEPKPVPIEETVPMRRINIVDALIQDLHNPDPSKRRKAIWELGQRGDSRAIQPLVDLMLDSDSSQRSLILGVLAEIGTRTVKPMNRALAVSLQDDSPEVRKNAIRDLTRIYDSIAQMSQLLNHAIDDDDGEVSETARWALGQLNRIRSLPKCED
jgi:hypothetical protein